MKNFYGIGLIILAMIIYLPTFPQKENAKGNLTGEQQIELSEGYSFISSRIMAENPDMQDVLQGNLVNLDFVRNSQGFMLQKIGPVWVNNIGDWANTEGYSFKMSTADELTITGDVIDPVTPISLEVGFQFVSYLPETSIDALIAFETILGDELDFIRNSQGQILRKIGPNWVNGIGDCNPGEGYLVKMIAADVLIYPIAFGQPCPGTPTVTDIDGNVYITVLIGSQCWMAENMKVTNYNNGAIIPNVKEPNEWLNLSTGAYVWYDNDPSWKDPYGALYNWFTVVDENGLCPEGWHIPSHNEWTELTNFIGGTGAPHANELKSCRQVSSPLGGECNTSEHPRWDDSNNSVFGTDDYGFSALPGGYRVGLGQFNLLGGYGAWWSSTEYSYWFSWGRSMFWDTENVGNFYDYKQVGRSVRCLKD